MKKNDEFRYWFPAQTFGWGWGLPATWEGWVVFIGFGVLLVLGRVYLLPILGGLYYTLYVFALSALLFAICFVKGEPPRWRWGK